MLAYHTCDTTTSRMHLFEASWPKIAFWSAAIVSRAILIVVLIVAHIGLMPDEAQYWTWSKAIDFGYYSKPPGIAWQIFLSTYLFGSTELGIRCIPLFLPIFSALLIARIVFKATEDSSSSYLAATAFILSPLGCTASIFATTDNPMIFFYLTALYAYISIERPIIRYLICGLLIAAGGLFKWVIYTLHIAFFRKEHGVSFCLGCLLSLSGIIPSLSWNASHEFATFRHMAAAIFESHLGSSLPNFPIFAISGIFLISPGFFALALPSLTSKHKSIKPIIIACTTVWSACLILSCFKKVQANWAVAGQTLFFPLLGISLHLHRSWQKLAYSTAIFLSVLLQGFALSTPLIAAKFLAISPFKQGLGLDQIQNVLSLSGYNPEKDFLFSSRYQTTSLLWFYRQDQKKTYFFNIDSTRHNQFMYWPGMPEECISRTGYFVMLVKPSEKDHLSINIERYRRKLEPFFSHVCEATVYPLKSIDQTVVHYLVILKALSYNGSQPKNTCKY